VNYASDEQQKDNARNAIHSLSKLEQRLCGRLILRQLNRGGKMGAEIAKYGPEGSVRLCSARSIIIYIYLFGVIGVALAIAGIDLVSALVFVLVFVLGVLSVIRSITANGFGKRWRAGHLEH